jgi:hypothetical protein
MTKYRSVNRLGLSVANRHRLVHAWVEGLVALISQPSKDAVELTYNPYCGDTFIRRDDGQPIASAPCCWFIGRAPSRPWKMATQLAVLKNDYRNAIPKRNSAKLLRW